MENHQKESQDFIPSSLKKLFYKGRVIVVASAALFSTLNQSCSDQKKKFVIIQSGNNITNTIINPTAQSLGYDTLNLSGEVRKEMLANIASLNNLENINLVHRGDTIFYDISALKEILEKDALSQTEYSSEGEKEQSNQKETKKSQSSVKIATMEDFKSSSEYLVRKLYNDKNYRTPIQNVIEQGFSVIIPMERESKESPSLKIEDITKVEVVRSNKLSGKKIVLDPGHGSRDPGAIGLAQYGEEKNKEKVVVYESAVAMDISYRVAKLLKEHGAKVVFTHYYNKRAIVDTGLLPPALRFIDSQKKENYQDIWKTSSWDDEGDAFSTDGRTKRANISNAENPNLFLSIHLDAPGNTNTKVCDILYQEKGNVIDKDSKKIGEKLMESGFGYRYNGKKCADVSHKVKGQNVTVLQKTNNPALLLEIANISNTNQAYVMRSAEKRQEIAANIVNALLKYYDSLK